MNKFLKLINFEINRFKKIYFILLLLTLIFQFIGVIFESVTYMNRANEAMIEQSITSVQYLRENGSFDFTFILNSFWFIAPILISITAFIFYIFFIWYRDWFGKNTFIYRLLMLPTSRLNIILSKAITIFLLVLGLIALQLILLPIENMVMKWIVSSEFRYDMTVAEIIGSSKEMYLIIPGSFIDFIIHYGVGLLGILVIFTGILFERSYRLKGIILGVLYGLLSLIVFFSPFLVEMIFNKDILYPVEKLILMIITFIIVLIASLYTSSYLLKKKVSV